MLSRIRTYLKGLLNPGYDQLIEPISEKVHRQLSAEIQALGETQEKTSNQIKGEIQEIHDRYTEEIQRVHNHYTDEIQRIHHHYVACQTRYLQQVGDELLRMQKMLDQLQDRQAVESNSAQNEP